MTEEEIKLKKEKLHEQIYAIRMFTNMAETFIDNDNTFSNQEFIQSLEVILSVYCGMLVISVPYYADKISNEQQIDEVLKQTILKYANNLNS